MTFEISRRCLMAAGAAALALGTAGSALAQAPTNLRFSACSRSRISALK
jgi:hypothetical protein